MPNLTAISCRKAIEHAMTVVTDEDVLWTLQAILDQQSDPADNLWEGNRYMVDAMDLWICG